MNAVCGGHDDRLPTPVALTPINGDEQPEDATFTALPGAVAHAGELNGGAYRIEMPDEWNGDLVIYMRGSQMFGNVLHAEAPTFLRDYLIEHGYAWASTSYDRTYEVYGAAADQSAALWDHFAARFGRPRRTYAVGDSMGGGAAIISAERYADRYDGALSACGVAGASPHYADYADLLVAGAFATGLSDAEFQRQYVWDSISNDILPRLASDPSARRLFETLWIDLSGGPRPYAVEGLKMAEDVKWITVPQWVERRVVDNSTTTYETEITGVTADLLNRDAIRLTVEGGPEIDPTEDIRGDVQIPTMLLHSTGDAVVPLRHVQHVMRLAEDNGRSDLVSVQLVPSPQHCGFTIDEYVAAFVSLVDWVETGDRPSCVLPLLEGPRGDETRQLAGC
jgi:pimeloyl-ACP methyl ester carboxylesterase